LSLAQLNKALCGRQALNRQISAVCGAAELLGGAKGFSCGRQTAQVTVPDRYSTTSKDSFREAIGSSQRNGRGLR